MDNNVYNLPFYIYKIFHRKIQKVRFKDVVLDKKTLNYFEEIHFKEISDSYTFLLNHVKSPIDCSIFIKSYFLLTNKRMSKRNAYQFVSIYYQFKECKLIELLSFLLEKINEIIKLRKFEYCLLLINYFFKRYKDEEIEIYPSMFQSLKNMFASKENIIASLLLLKRSAESNEQKEKKDISKEEIMNFFHMNQIILKTKFLIKRLFLFGSFSEETYHNQSDLDLLVIFDGSITKGEKMSLNKKIKKYIEEKLKIQTDVIDFEYAITSMDFMSLNRILTIY